MPSGEMTAVTAIVHKDEGSAYGVTFPDIPGCFSAADRLEDVLPRAREALALWYQDDPAVNPDELEIRFTVEPC